MTTLLDTIIFAVDLAGIRAARLARQHEAFRQGEPDSLAVGLYRQAKQVAEAYAHIDELLLKLVEPGSQDKWTVYDQGPGATTLGGSSLPRTFIFQEHVVSSYLELVSVNGGIKVTREKDSVTVEPYGGSYFNKLACEQIKDILLQNHEE